MRTFVSRCALALAALLFVPVLRAAPIAPPLLHAPVNVADTASLQRGARDFVNYCMGCHELKYMRWSRLGRDLKLGPKALRRLMFLQTKPFQMMTNAMPRAEATKFFGEPPPDLSVMASEKGADWIYTYLQSFYLDPSRPTGVNNLVFYNVAMPDPFWHLQGLRRAVFRKVRVNGSMRRRFVRFVTVVPGTMSPKAFQRRVGNITNFLVYVANPDRLKAMAMGIRVLAFLVLFTIFAYLLKREIWKDVHH
jgi:ubiquinol-cytochrome c reductase cytochrome c1 subunit